MLKKNENVKIEVYKYDEWNIWIEKNNNQVYAYLNMDGYGVVMDMWGSNITENQTYDDFIALVEYSLGEYIDMYVDTYVF